MLKSSVVTKLAFDVLRDAEKHCSNDHKIPREMLLKLHSVFGNTLTLATELLESCKIIKYHTRDNFRRVYKIGSGVERYTIYNNINFCQCLTFKHQVLEDKSCLTCKHVLAVKLNEITRVCPVKTEVVTDSQIVEFLNEQVNHVDDV